MLLDSGRWEEAGEYVEELSDGAFEEVPALHFTAALSQLLRAVPSEFREAVAGQVPFNAAAWELASDLEATRARAEALRHFVAAGKAALERKCVETAAIAEEYALWLELADPATREAAGRRAKASISDPRGTGLNLVYVAVPFGIELDMSALKGEIDRQVALRRGYRRSTALARLALCLASESPGTAARDVSRYLKELSGCLEEKALRMLELNLYAAAGRPDRAQACLDDLLGQGISADEAGRLRSVVAEAEGSDPMWSAGRSTSGRGHS